MTRATIWTMVCCLFIRTATNAQEIFPSGSAGVGGSYNLSFPAGNCFSANRPIGNGNSASICKGPNYAGPFQTHQWWNSALWHVDYMSNTQSMHSGVMHPHPLILQAGNDGFVLRYRHQDYQAGAVDVNYFTADQDLKVGLESRTATQTQVDDYGHWHVKLLQQTGSGNDLYMTSAAGCPFTFYEKTGTSFPIIQGGNLRVFAASPNALGLISNTNSFSYPDNYFIVTMPTGTSVSLSNGAFVNPATIAVNTSLSTLRLNLPSGSFYFSVGLLPDNSAGAFSLFNVRGLNFITGSDFSYSYNEAAASVTSTFTLTTIARDGSVNEGTLQAIYRHQYLFSPEAASLNTGHTYRSPRGTMPLIQSSAFTTTQSYYGCLPMLAKANNADQAELNAMVNSFASTTQINTPASLNYDMYNTFIAISQAARMAEVANQTGNIAARDKCLDAAKYWIENWLRSPNGEVCRTVHFSPTFNWLTCYPDAFQADIGIHDSHFMYGYLIMGAAIVGRFEQKRFGNLNWVNLWKPMIDLMVRNINDWNKTCATSASDGSNPCFPYLRYFDPYAGHSWALNYTESQESVSEAVQFATGAALWGDLTGNTAMRDMGIMLFVHESEAGRQYWFDTDNTDLHRAPFAADYPYQHAGIVYTWGHKYGTFFGTQPYQIHGITYWAISGASVWMGVNRTGLQRDYTDFLTAYGGNVSGTAAEGYWSTEMLSAMALYNPSGAISRFNSIVLNNDGVFDVNAEMKAYRGIAYQWISTLDSVGTVDPTIKANTDFYSVFYKNNCRHYMVYNGPNQVGKTVTFTDGKQFYVPSDTLMVVKDCNLDALPVSLFDFSGKRKNSHSVALSWQFLSDEPVEIQVQRSEDAETFYPIFTQFYTGSATDSYIDQHAFAHLLYYRMIFYYSNRSSENSAVISIQNPPEAYTEVVYLHDELRVRLSASPDGLCLQDLLGRKIWSNKDKCNSVFLVPDAVYILHQIPDKND